MNISVARGGKLKRQNANGFSRTDLFAIVAVLSVLAALATVALVKQQREARLQLCTSNLQQVNKAVLAFANDHGGTLPGTLHTEKGPSWWWYKDEIRSYSGLTGASSPDDKLFACPLDRGYSDPGPFWKNPRFNYTSYVFNGVTLLGAPNIAGWKISSVAAPTKTLTVMEWSAHGPLSWHRSRTGKANGPFYRDAESIVAFVDGHVSFTKIYFDGYNPAYTRDPIAGYSYKFSGK
jgi:prepilin-type processing-associated H-X9-DG protein